MEASNMTNMTELSTINKGNEVPKVVEIEIIPIELEGGTQSQMVSIKDISYALKNEKEKLRSNFQQQLTMSLSHEQMTPLNSILSLSEVVYTKLMAQEQATG